jgi:mRNA interferase RelE/StbE
LYKLNLPKRVQKSLDKLNPQERLKIQLVLLKLKENPKPYDSQKLTSVPLWRIREGDYRIVYNIDEKEKAITVVRIGHRREIYRGF